MTTHSSILAGRISWTEGDGWLQSMGYKELDTTEKPTHIHTCTISYKKWVNNIIITLQGDRRLLALSY